MLDDTYGVFAHKAIAPLVQIDSNEWVGWELFSRADPRRFKNLHCKRWATAGLRAGTA